MFCPSCGSENPGNAQFCGGCGQRIATTPQRPDAQPPVAQAAPPAPVAPPALPAPSRPPAPPVVNTPPAAPQPSQPSGPAHVPTHLFMAIVATLCCFCPPVGIVSLVFALQVPGKLKSGDIAGAQRASSSAKTWGIVAIILGLIINSIGLVIAIAQQMDQM